VIISVAVLKVVVKVSVPDRQSDSELYRIRDLLIVEGVVATVVRTTTVEVMTLVTDTVEVQCCGKKEVQKDSAGGYFESGRRSSYGSWEHTAAETDAAWEMEAMQTSRRREKTPL